MVTKLSQRSYERSRTAFREARKVMPGGVSSPVRAYKAVGRDPITITSGKGPYVKDLDGNRYVDYVGSYGPLILGHTPKIVIDAVKKAASEGTSFGMPTTRETQLARLVIEAVPSIELVRFVNSGTEATMSAIRLARAATNRPIVIKCAGCYHGHSDGLLVQAGSGATTLGQPSSPGIPPQITANSVLVPYNDLDAMRRVMTAHAGKVAAIIIEPVAGNMGTILPRKGYLKGLRSLCNEHGALLIFDEVMTGFRVAYGGVQSICKVKPDLTCLGKVIGGGLPCAAYGGREKLMRMMSPDGPVYQAGTLSGNPLAMAAGIAMLKTLRGGDAYVKLEKASAALEAGLTQRAADAGVPLRIVRIGSMITCFFTSASSAPTNYEEACQCDTAAFGRFFGAMLDRGVVLPPSQFETWFVSTAHDKKSIAATLAAAVAGFKAAARSAKG